MIRAVCVTHAAQHARKWHYILVLLFPPAIDCIYDAYRFSEFNEDYSPFLRRRQVSRPKCKNVIHSDARAHCGASQASSVFTLIWRSRGGSLQRRPFADRRR